jgi:hypothetical protein
MRGYYDSGGVQDKHIMYKRYLRSRNVSGGLGARCRTGCGVARRGPGGMLGVKSRNSKQSCGLKETVVFAGGARKNA